MTKMSYFTKGHLVRDVVMHHYETLQETQTIAEAVELLPKLNVFDDAKVAAAVNHARVLAGLNADAVRGSLGAKSRAAQQVTAVAKSVADTFAIDIGDLLGNEFGEGQCDLLSALA